MLHTICKTFTMSELRFSVRHFKIQKYGKHSKSLRNIYNKNCDIVTLGLKIHFRKTHIGRLESEVMSMYLNGFNR